jgi:hypothetical protein
MKKRRKKKKRSGRAEGGIYRREMTPRI